MKQTGEEYRHKNKKRLQRYFQKHLSEGKKRITALLDGDVYQALIDHKDKEGISINKAVEDAMRVVYLDVIQTDIPEQAGKTDVIALMAGHRANGLSWPDVADALNNQGVTTARGGAWTGPNCQAFYSRNK